MNRYSIVLLIFVYFTYAIEARLKVPSLIKIAFGRHVLVQNSNFELK